MKSCCSFSVLLLLLSFAFKGIHSFAQQPAYTIFGEDQFRGIQVYDVIQDNDKNFWFSTSEGLYFYDFNNYQKIECDRAKSSSVFNFIKDKNGIIYCNNINNQIFKIQNKKLKLFYELKKEDANADISLAFGDDDCILVSSRKIISLNSNGKIKAKVNNLQYYVGQPFRLNNGEIIYHLSGHKTLIIYSKGKFKRKEINIPIDINVLTFVKIGKKTFGISLDTKKCYRLDTENYQFSKLTDNPILEKSQHVRFYVTNQGVWMAGTLPGCYLFDKTISDSKKESWFPNYYISDVYIDHEGNTLLSTFDKGIILIPDLKTPDVLLSSQDDPITSLTANSNSLFLGSSKGKLLAFNSDNLTSLNQNWKRSIEVMKANPAGTNVILDDGEIRLLDIKSKRLKTISLASLKDVTYINSTKCYFGTNIGLYFYDFSSDKNTAQLVKEFNERIHHIEYNRTNKSLYVSSISGINLLKANGKKIPLLYNNKQIFPLDISASGKYTYICTKENGILVYHNEHLVEQIKIFDRNQLLTIEKLDFYKKHLVGNSSNGIYLFNKKGTINKRFHLVYGFQNKRIIDFSLQNNNLWISHSGGIQKINLSQQKSTTKQKLYTRINKLEVNNETQKLSKQNILFTSDQRKFVFTVSSPTLRNRELLNYQYRLIGADSSWNSNSYQNHQIVFNSLAPGKYQFELRVEYNGQFSPTVKYKFEIKAPFYFRWWFISLVIVSFFFFVYQIYKRQLAKQKRKSDQINELNASKLTAIQSQMNPHFIFNAMNSIQDLILKGNVEHSYSYITTFSNLVRKTLNYSEREFIEFEQEIELLELYLSLEKLRFKTEFSYSIDTNSISSIKIPPMLIQPFIENALGHGLIHRDGKKTLHISFELQDVLLCKIEDNGVGRNKAKEIRERQRADHESFSGRAIQKRFEILSNHYNGKLGFEYVDKIENGESTGTIVFLKIPYFQNF